MTTRKTFFFLGILALLMALVACGGKDGEEAQDAYPAPEATIDPTMLMDSAQLQPEGTIPTQAPNQPAQPTDTPTPKNVPSVNGWCMNSNGAAAYPHRAMFYSDSAGGNIVCRTDKGGFLTVRGNTIPTQIVTTMPAVDYYPWDGVTYADEP